MKNSFSQSQQNQSNVEKTLSPSFGRRDFLRTTGLTATMLMSSRINVMAGPFSVTDFDKIIPANKKLSYEWINSLYARGQRLTATGADLKYIGMPINGICTGQVYLGGDGTLWRWNLDGSRDLKKETTKGPRYLDPDVSRSPMNQGFALQVAGREFTLDSKGFGKVVFTSQYPMATVDYADVSCPVDVQLQAYTPFIPLNRDDSSYPVIIMRYTIKNTSSSDQDVSIAGWIENISNKKSGKGAKGEKLCYYRELDDISTVECFARFGDSLASGFAETEIFADFEGGTYGAWTVEGEAFGQRPSKGADKEGVQKLSGMRGKGLANSWTGSDQLKGKLISPTFIVEKPYINFLIGGGAGKKLTATLWIDGQKVRSATGKKSDAMNWVSWSVKDLKGKRAQFEILDSSSMGWGHIEVDQIEFSTHVPTTKLASKLTQEADYGSIALGLIGADRPEIVDIARDQSNGTAVFQPKKDDLKDGVSHSRDFNEPGFASMGQRVNLAPGESKTIRFALSWRFPTTLHAPKFGKPNTKDKNHYATLWPTAADTADSVAAREEELHGTTQQWVNTWYDSTLPYWILERAFVPINCVQTQMGQRFVYQDGSEHYNFEEGVKCCPGNCTHVWHYAQGLARIFPQIERECRDKIEFGLGFDSKTGVMQHRYTAEKYGDAIDGNCGTILRVLRESQMTSDYSFLESIWGRVKIAMDHVIQKWDADEDGLLEGSQHNTLDEPWYGQVHWLINLYHAALKASAVMARQMNDVVVAQRYEAIVAKGAPAMVEMLWNEEFGYFVHIPGASNDQKHGSTKGCHIDQVLGDSWLHNLGIEPILPKDKIRQSLEALWKYNFTPDVGAFRKAMTNGRWYATAGDAGLVMCTFPHGKIEPKSGKKSYAGYLNECMTGFEWQVAAHMIWVGMTEEGLAIGKAIYDRYLPKDRNPYNEIECSDHYSRAMASYGVFTAICGFQYDGPQGKLAFGPRLTRKDFRAGFTAAEGWGSFSQKVTGGQQSASIDLRYGELALNEFALDQVVGTHATKVKAQIDDQLIETRFQTESGQYIVSFAETLRLKEGQTLLVDYLA